LRCLVELALPGQAETATVHFEFTRQLIREHRHQLLFERSLIMTIALGAASTTWRKRSSLFLRARSIECCCAISEWMGAVHIETLPQA